MTLDAWNAKTNIWTVARENCKKTSSNTFFISPYPLELTFLLAFKNLLKLILTTTTLWKLNLTFLEKQYFGFDIQVQIWYYKSLELQEKNIYGKVLFFSNLNLISFVNLIKIRNNRKIFRPSWIIYLEIFACFSATSFYHKWNRTTILIIF